MPRIFRSKSCDLRNSSLIDIEIQNPFIFLKGGDEDNTEFNSRLRSCGYGDRRREQYQFLALLVAAVRKSIKCAAGTEDASAMEIGSPKNVRHVSHVTFNRFDGFLGLPMEFQPEIPLQVPSASASVFSVSVESMQCSLDRRGNSVPTILLMMQNRLYYAGGLKAEGIFRINPENSKEEQVREQLNKGVIPSEIDVHCLAALIKAWFRELPYGILDSLSAKKMMRCKTEEQCCDLVKLLPRTESALLDWSVNLMADVAENEVDNRMNAQNIATVFAPNMTQVEDPLTALIHAVQVMKFLKTLILRTMRERASECSGFESSS